MKVRDLKRILDELDEDADLFAAPVLQINETGRLIEQDRIISTDQEEYSDYIDESRKMTFTGDVVVYGHPEKDPAHFCILGLEDVFNILDTEMFGAE